MLALPANPGCGPDTYQAAWNMHKWATQKLQQDRAWRCWAHICWPIGIHQRSPDNWQQFFMNDNAMAWQGRAWLLDHTYSNDIYIYIYIYMYIYIYIYTLYCVYSNYSNPWYSNAWCAWSRNGLLKEGPCMWARRCKAASQLAARIAVQSFFCFLSFSSYFTLPFPPRLPKKTKMSTSLLAPWPSINTRAKTA